MSNRLPALDFITGCLGCCNEPDYNDELRSTIKSGNWRWEDVVYIANTELVTPALWVALENRQLTEQAPADVGDYLCELHHLNTTRNARLRAQAMEIVRRLNAIGIEPLLLKGAAGLFVETFGDPGSRVMADLDLLVPRSVAQDCWDTLHAAGYGPIRDSRDRLDAGLHPIDYDHHHHLRPLHRPGDYATVEIHRAALLKAHIRLLPDAMLWNNAEPVREADIAMSVPAPTHRVLHSLVHCAFADRYYAHGKIPLRAFHELARMQLRYQDRIEWKVIRQQFDAAGQLRALTSMIYLAHKFFANPLPEGIDPTPTSKLHYARARLQTRWQWTERLVERMLWFSAEDICDRYGCGDDRVSLSRRRLRLAGSIAVNKVNRLARRVLNQRRMGTAPSSRR